MKYFTNSMTLDEVKAAYRKYALQLHPDMGGSNEAMTELTHEFEIAFAIAKRTMPKQTTATTETAQSYQRAFYKQRGWKGSRYNSSLTTKDITKIVRDYIKYVHPTYRFSVTLGRYNSITVALMKYPVELTNYGLMHN